MRPCLRGGLISESYASTELLTLAGTRDPLRDDTLLRVLSSIERHLGPASGLRTITDIAAIPLLEALGYRVVSRGDEGGLCRIQITAASRRATMVVALWGVSPEAVRRQALLSAIAADARWCLLCNGQVVRLIDSHRAWSRQHLEFDIHILTHDADARALFWTLLNASAIAGVDPLLDRAVEQSARHGVAVCRALSDGVLEALDTVVGALSRRHPDPGQHRPASGVLLEESLTVLYRVLFLLFAEARSLVPVWDPIYRDRYTIEAIVATLLSGRRYRGVWPALQAISRLAHAGCRAGPLKVTPFNGRLFSPAHVASIERARLDDETMGRAVMAVSTVARKGAGRQRIVYHDLDVEQLGSVYERVLDYEVSQDATLEKTGDRRKASGSFYTPRSVTDWVVRRTLAPLVEAKTATQILQLRVVDPAMGSGAFLVSACRYLAGAAESALVREGGWREGSISDCDRVGLRRQIAQRCLYGVDLNPMAVQLARLSLWLATLAHDKPLSFLDHHLVGGDSLVGAALADLTRQPPGRRHPGTTKPLPLFADGAFDAIVEDILPQRMKLAFEPDDNVTAVHQKEALLGSLLRRPERLMLKSALDLWCACWFWHGSPRPDRAVYGELHAALTGGPASLPGPVVARWLDASAAIAAEHRFLHWELEFPEVFFDEHGRRRPDAGFDAVVGNPPWDMIRGDSGKDAVREARRQDAGQLVAFVREAGVYLTSSRAHANRYQLFLERSLQLTRRGGRIGVVLPGGAMSDAGAGAVRRHFFDHARVDSVVGLDNRRGIFPIHRGLRISLVTATTGTPTDRISCRFGVTDSDGLHKHGAREVVLTRRLLERLSGEDDLGVPEVASPTDLAILERMSTTAPRLGSADGWNVQFGRELNATDDRGAFVQATHGASARCVLEGKQIEPFRVDVAASRSELREDAVAGSKVPRRARLAYRDVASATNRLTLIAAIVPARAVTTHTLFVLRTQMPLQRQHTLCALLNSFVANYLIRTRVSTHVTAGLMSRLPVPLPDPGTAERLAELAVALSSAPEQIDAMSEYAELQAIAARLYGLNRPEFEHVLSTFPLIADETKRRCLATLDRH